jgi:hypothetical protein
MSNEATLLNDAQMRGFIADGYVTVQADLPAASHERLYGRLEDVYAKSGNEGNNLLPRIPEIQGVFDCPAVRGALTSLLGPGYLMNPHRYGHLNPSGGPGQKWHKDSYIDHNVRHPRFRAILAFYYPQDVTEDMGPTGILPGRQNHVGVSDVDPEKTVERALPLCGGAGAVTLVHFDSWHRATPNRSQKKRYMLKFLFERMAEPCGPAWDCRDTAWQSSGEDPTPGLSRDVWGWLAGTRGAAGGGGEVSRLIAGLRDPSETARLNAAYALGAMGGRAAPALMASLPEEAEAVFGQGRTNDPADVRGRNPTAPCSAHALAAIGHPAVLFLIDALQDARWAVRAAAADTLGDIGPPATEAVPMLTTLLKDEHWRVRRHAAEALGMVGAEDGEVVRGLTGALGDEAATVRLNAALALGKIGPPSAEAVPALTALMNDENRYVRHYAAVGLRRIDTPDARETLMDALFTSRWCPITTKETPY